MPNNILETLTIDGVSLDTPQGGGGVTGVKGEQETAFRTGDVNLDIDNLAYLGTNPTGGVANDTKAVWKELGTGYALISQAGMVNGQPSTYGFIISISRGSNYLAQYFLSTPTGQLYRRGNNAAATTDLPAFVAVDNDTTYSAGENLTLSGTEFSLITSPALKGTPTTPSITDKSVSTTQVANSAFVQGAINRRLPKSLESTNEITFNQASGTTKTFKGSSLFTADATGTFVGLCWFQFDVNATGVRGAFVGLADSSSGAVTQGGCGMQVMASPNGNTELCVPVIYRMSSGQMLRAAMIQNSGSTLSVRAYCKGIFITD